MRLFVCLFLCMNGKRSKPLAYSESPTVKPNVGFNVATGTKRLPVKSERNQHRRHILYIATARAANFVVVFSVLWRPTSVIMQRIFSSSLLLLFILSLVTPVCSLLVLMQQPGAGMLQ